MTREFKERFLSADDWTAYEDGTASSDVGPLPLVGTVNQYLGEPPVLKEKKGCVSCGADIWDKWTRTCAGHYLHHLKRVEARKAEHTLYPVQPHSAV